MRTMRAQNVTSQIVQAIVSRKALAAVKNKYYIVGITSSTTPSGGSKLEFWNEKSNCNNPSTTADETEDFSTLSDVHICLIRDTTAPAVTYATTCLNMTAYLCITPEGMVYNSYPTFSDPDFTMIYIREYLTEGGTVVPAGVIRQVVIPRRRTVRANPVQVSNDACL